MTEVSVKSGILKGITFKGDLENSSLDGNFDTCDFTGLNMRGVSLNGTFNNCKFKPELGIARERVRWSGEFIGGNGVREK